MAVTPTGILSLPIDYLRDLIAAVTAFQTWTGTANAAAAKARIHVNALNKADIVRPFGIVGTGPGTVFIPPSMGAYGQHNLHLILESAAITTGLSHEDAVYTFLNSVGPIIEGAAELAGTPGYLVVQQIEFAKFVERSAPPETVDYFQAHWIFRTGARP